MKTKKNIQSICKKNTFKKQADLLFIGQEGKRHYVLIKNLNRLMYNHAFSRGRKHFCRCFILVFSTSKILKSHVNYCFKINGTHAND